MKSRNYVYEYEMTRKRKFFKGLEQVVNYGVTIAFGAVVLGGITLAIINLLQ